MDFRKDLRQIRYSLGYFRLRPAYRHSVKRFLTCVFYHKKDFWLSFFIKQLLQVPFDMPRTDLEFFSNIREVIRIRNRLPGDEYTGEFWLPSQSFLVNLFLCLFQIHHVEDPRFIHHGESIRTLGVDLDTGEPFYGFWRAYNNLKRERNSKSWPKVTSTT